MVKVEMVVEPGVDIPDLTLAVTGRIARYVFRRHSEVGKRWLAVETAFVGSETIRGLNRRHRGQDSATDVLAFRLNGDDFPQPDALQCPERLAGSVVVCPQQAQDMPGAECSSPLRRLAFVTCHGLLHLAGWDHPDELTLSRMHESTEEIMEHVFPAGW